MPGSLEITHAYRHLYRALLHAVQYSKPSRYTGRDLLRNAFRKEDPSNFHPERIQRTVEFLNFAARETGLEHKLVKGLLFTAFSRAEDTKRPSTRSMSKAEREIIRKARTHYDMTLAMLNDTMGLCLR